MRCKKKIKQVNKKEECKVYIKRFNVKQKHLCCIPEKLPHFIIQKKIIKVNVWHLFLAYVDYKHLALWLNLMMSVKVPINIIV